VPYRWVDHTSELELEIAASDEAAVFELALQALAELLEGEPAGGPVEHELTAEAPDRAALLAEWLSELVYLAETEDLIPDAVITLELDPGRLRAVVRGRRGHPRHLVKAVTYHRLAMERAGEDWRARVVLDV
jgi:SHS2 domain-containing protein